MQNRAIYDRMNGELGSDTTRKVYQDRKDRFYLDFAVMTCDCGGEVRGVARMEFFCGLTTFIESIKAIRGVKLKVI